MLTDSTPLGEGMFVMKQGNPGVHYDVPVWPKLGARAIDARRQFEQSCKVPASPRLHVAVSTCREDWFLGKAVYSFYHEVSALVEREHIRSSKSPAFLDRLFSEKGTQTATSDHLVRAEVW